MKAIKAIIDICSDGSKLQGKVIGDPQEIIRIVCNILRKICDISNLSFEKVLEILSNCNKMEEITDFAVEQIMEGTMSQEQAIAFSDSLINAVLNKNDKSKD